MADNSTLIMTIFAYYIAVAVILGLIGSSYLPNQEINSNLENPGISNVLSSIGQFFLGLTFVITNFPAWANILLFLPLGLTILYIMIERIIDLIPG